jgi:hypothetical protein
MVFPYGDIYVSLCIVLCWKVVQHIYDGTRKISRHTSANSAQIVICLCDFLSHTGLSYIFSSKLCASFPIKINCIVNFCTSSLVDSHHLLEFEFCQGLCRTRNFFRLSSLFVTGCIGQMAKPGFDEKALPFDFSKENTSIAARHPGLQAGFDINASLVARG